MIDHTGIHVADLARSKAFYTPVLATLGYVVRKEIDGAVGYGAADPLPHEDPAGDFWIAQADPYTPRSHVAFRAGDEAQVRAFHAAALAAGGRDNGEPGLRPRYHARYYAAFVSDPDGYNIEAVFHQSDAAASR